MRSDTGETYRVEYSVEDAKRAGLWQDKARITKRRKDGSTYEADNDSPWFRYPQRMLPVAPDRLLPPHPVRRYPHGHHR